MSATDQGPAGIAAELTPAEAQQRAQASAQLMWKFGEIVSVLMRSPQYRAMALGAVEGLVMPPLLTGQFLVAEVGFVTPVAAALWASVSPEIDARLSSSLDQPMQLAPNEWKSGDIPWFIAIVGDQRVLGPVLKGMQQSVLKGRPLKMRATNKEGQQVVATYSGDAPAA